MKKVGIYLLLINRRTRVDRLCQRELKRRREKVVPHWREVPRRRLTGRRLCGGSL